jgi:hypothetical protein
VADIRMETADVAPTFGGFGTFGKPQARSARVLPAFPWVRDQMVHRNRNGSTDGAANVKEALTTFLSQSLAMDANNSKQRQARAIPTHGNAVVLCRTGG